MVLVDYDGYHDTHYIENAPERKIRCAQNPKQLVGPLMIVRIHYRSLLTGVVIGTTSHGGIRASAVT